MRPWRCAGLLGLATLGAHAQYLPSAPANAATASLAATRLLEPYDSLRDVIVIPREEIEAAGPLSLGELLQRRAGIELAAAGGPGQPQALLIRGMDAAQTLVLVDGLRVGTANGTAMVENLPLDMIERIEVVKGPLASLYGSGAAGGVIRIATRGKTVPYLFGSTGYGSDRDRRASAGLSTADDTTVLAVAAGVRKVDAPSATNARSARYDPDRDPHENAFGVLHASHRAWNGELLSLDLFGSRSRTAFDAGLPAAGAPEDRRDPTTAGARLTSLTHFAPWWASSLAIGTSIDRNALHGQSTTSFELQQDQATWINQVPLTNGGLAAGLETVRERVQPSEAYTVTHRDTNSGFVSVVQRQDQQQVEMSARRDRDPQFGDRNSASVSYGFDWPSVARIGGTWSRGFRVPSFDELYGLGSAGYASNPALVPETGRGREIIVRAPAASPLQWKLTAFDNRVDHAIVHDPLALTISNVPHARIDGLEASVETTTWGTRWRARFTAQRPRDEDTGERLPGRAKRFGALDASRGFGSWTVEATVFASGDRVDAPDVARNARLGGYTVVDARVGYRIDKHWSLNLNGTNLGDRRYEDATGYDAPRRAVFLSVRFESY